MKHLITAIACVILHIFLTVYAFYLPLCFVLEYANCNYFWCVMHIICFPLTLFLRNLVWDIVRKHWRCYKQSKYRNEKDLS